MSSASAAAFHLTDLILCQQHNVLLNCWYIYT
jgi:hypothetical protein